jgi:hypothetical protein
MTPQSASACIKQLRPKVVYPYHFDNAAATRIANPAAPPRAPAPAVAGRWDVRTNSPANRAGIETFKQLLAREPIEVRIGAFYPAPVAR